MRSRLCLKPHPLQMTALQAATGKPFRAGNGTLRNRSGGDRAMENFPRHEVLRRTPRPGYVVP
jgi:hypothetical protein